MIRFKTKDNLIKWLIDNCPRKAVVRSLLQDRAECLGGFSKIPPSTCPGWIVRVTSLFDKKRKWIVAVIAHQDKPRYGIRILSRVPWEYWMGDIENASEVYSGDNSSIYKKLREVCRRKNNGKYSQKKE